MLYMLRWLTKSQGCKDGLVDCLAQHNKEITLQTANVLGFSEEKLKLLKGLLISVQYQQDYKYYPYKHNRNKHIVANISIKCYKYDWQQKRESIRKKELHWRYDFSIQTESYI